MNAIRELINKIPFNRFILYLIVLGFLPLIFVTFHYYKKERVWNEMTHRLLDMRMRWDSKARKQSHNTIIKKIYSDFDQIYLENHLETLTFLKKEREALEQLVHSPAFIGNEAAEKRLSFLTSKANHVEFVHGSGVMATEGMQEIACQMSHPVEIDASDLKEILSRIEGTRKGKPQLLITDFKINKKAHNSGNEVFELNLKLLKREFVK